MLAVASVGLAGQQRLLHEVRDRALLGELTSWDLDVAAGDVRHSRLVAEFRVTGIRSRAVLPGPLSLARSFDAKLEEPAEALTAFYEKLLPVLAARGETGVQLDEPVLARPLGAGEAVAAGGVYRRLRAAAAGLALTLTCSPRALAPENVALATRLHVDAIHLDLLSEPRLPTRAIAELRPGQRLILGIADVSGSGPAIPASARGAVGAALATLGVERIEIAPAASLDSLPFGELPGDPAAANARGRLAALKQFASAPPIATSPDAAAVPVSSVEGGVDD